MKKPFLILFSALVLALSLLNCPKATAATDTVFVLSLEVNMTKAIQTGIFDPSLDRLYVVFDSLLGVEQLVNSGHNKFTLLLSDGIDSGAVYNFHFQINDFITETLSRQIKIQHGINSYKYWWNNDYLNYSWFQVDMSYMVQQHVFRPDTDYVDMVGSMNNFQGSPQFTRIGTTYVYQTMYNLDPGTTSAFKFRINGDSNKVELKGKPSRFFLAPDSVIHMLYWFNNYNTAKIPMQFYCDMSYMTRAGHFNRQYDHVDVAGSFNDAGAYDILYDYDKDSIYTATVLIDTSYIRQNPITFKYRINSSWLTAELEGKPFRTYILHDTAQGPDIDTSWYNNWNPAIPTPPIVSNVAIQGRYIFNQVITGIYSYENINGIPEGKSTYQWYRSADSLGTTLTPIDTAIHITYTIDTNSIHQWLVFEVTPIAVSGDSAIGKPVRVVTQTSIGYTGIDDKDNLISLVYPNPCNDRLLIEGRADIRRVELYDLTGRLVFISDGINSRKTLINPSALLPGVYILKASGKNNENGWNRIVRQ
ncbi:MAG: T9SS type A sorting domain-containing protein [Bacteroidota bacterium]